MSILFQWNDKDKKDYVRIWTLKALFQQHYLRYSLQSPKENKPKQNVEFFLVSLPLRRRIPSLFIHFRKYSITRTKYFSHQQGTTFYWHTRIMYSNKNRVHLRLYIEILFMLDNKLHSSSKARLPTFFLGKNKCINK